MHYKEHALSVWVTMPPVQGRASSLSSVAAAVEWMLTGAHVGKVVVDLRSGARTREQS